MKKKQNYESNKEQVLQKMSVNVAVLFRNVIYQDI